MFSLKRVFMGAVALAFAASISTAQLTLSPSPGTSSNSNRPSDFGFGGDASQIGGISLGGSTVISGGGGRGGRGGRGGGGGGGGRSFGTRNSDLANPAVRAGLPMWQNDPAFPNDTFTFVRIQFDSYGRGGAWNTDYPDTDLNLPFRLHQMTSMKVEPISISMRLTDPRLFDFPFIYLTEVGSLEFSPAERVALRRYLLNGGFAMIDDHWGLQAQANFLREMRLVFPERQAVELPLEHPIFHTVFDLKAKPQVPGINTWTGRGVTWEASDDREPHYRAWYDDRGRMMMLQCANTDLSDGWEREGVNEEYFHMFSEKQAYPMIINILFYTMTH